MQYSLTNFVLYNSTHSPLTLQNTRRKQQNSVVFFFQTRFNLVIKKQLELEEGYQKIFSIICTFVAFIGKPFRQMCCHHVA